MYGKLLQHLRDQRSRHNNFFRFSANDLGRDDDDVSVDDASTVSAKDLTKYAYGVAKGMEFIVSKGVSLLLCPTLLWYDLLYV